MKTYLLKVSALIIITSLFINCKNSNDNTIDEPFQKPRPVVESTAFDGNSTNSSETVQIGGLDWTSRNLDVSTFKNGDTIFHAKTNKDWERAGKLHLPAYCYYDNNPSNGTAYGKLYNWYAVMDERGLAPEGYFIPSDNEFWVLLGYYNMYQHSSNEKSAMASQKLKSKDSDSFHALLGGYRSEAGGFHDMNEAGRWWSSENFWNKTLNGTKSNLFPSELHIDNTFVSGPGAGVYDAGCGYSIRCVKGESKRTTKIPVLESEYIEVDKNGKPRNGAVTFYSNMGNVSKTFVNGVENGERLSFSPYSDLISKEMFKNGQLNGLSIYYHDSHWKHKTHEGKYVNGKKEGEWIYYDWVAKPELAEKFEMRITHREYYKNNEMTNKIYEGRP
ncbi:FISUMP domain-containing protein [Flavobacterium sp.]|uniref:FISUMP domain-containing protein n=1 Tax=Flavobacterium sp. TaxID=239 RepID=UPI003D6C3325